LLLSVRELVRQGYLYAAMVLLRPMVERIGTLSYLIEHPDGLATWQAGWKHGTGPSLVELLETIRGLSDATSAPSDDEIAIGARRYHELVNVGCPSAMPAVFVTLGNGAPGFTTGKDIHSPENADAVAYEAAMMAIVLMSRCVQVFPKA
jgi:hypothetical protein